MPFPMNTLPSKSSFDKSPELDETKPSLKTLLIILLLSIVILLLGVFLGNRIVTIVGSLIAIIMAGRIFYPSVKSSLTELISPKDGGVLLASIGLGFGLVGLLQSLGASRWIS